MFSSNIPRAHTKTIVVQVNQEWGYRDGVKRKGDKIAMDCTVSLCVTE